MNTQDLENRYVVGLGEILFDVFPTGSKLGGAPANFAHHAGQHGLHSVAVSAVGNDMLGDEAVRLLNDKDLHHLLPVVDYPTGTVQVSLDKDGVPTYDIKQGVAWDNIPFTEETLEVAENAAAVCWGSLAQRSEKSRNTIYEFLDHTPEDCLKIFDINLRQNFYTKEIICESLRRCNILKINDEELVTIGRLFGYAGLDMENKCWLILGKYNLGCERQLCVRPRLQVLPGDSQGEGGRYRWRRRQLHRHLLRRPAERHESDCRPRARSEGKCLRMHTERRHARTSRLHETVIREEP